MELVMKGGEIVLLAWELLEVDASYVVLLLRSSPLWTDASSLSHVLQADGCGNSTNEKSVQSCVQSKEHSVGEIEAADATYERCEK